LPSHYTIEQVQNADFRITQPSIDWIDIYALRYCGQILWFELLWHPNLSSSCQKMQTERTPLVIKFRP